MPSKLFGSKQSSSTVNSTERFQPINIRTFVDGNQLLNTTGKNKITARFNLPDFINNLRDDSLNRTQSLVDRVFQPTFQNELVDARVRPVRERFANLGGSIGRRLAQRGVTGSIRDNALIDLERTAAQEEGNARFLAERDVLGLQDMFAQRLNQFGTEELNKQLALLGLSPQRLPIASTQPVGGGTTEQTSTPSSASTIGSILFGLGGLF